MIWDLKNIFEKKKISVLVPNFNFSPKNMRDKSIKDGYRVEVYKRFLIITTERSNYLKNSIPHILKLVVSELRKYPESYYPYMLLAWCYYINNDRAQLEYWYNELMSIKNFEDKMIQTSIGRKKLKDIRSLLE